jgi:hypothetical protein
MDGSVRQTEVEAHPAKVLVGVDVAVLVAGGVGTESPVAHGQPHVVQGGEFPPREVGPVLRVHDLEEHGRERDGGEGGVAHGGPQPLREFDQTPVPFRMVRDIGPPFDVEADAVEAMAFETEVAHRFEAPHVGVQVVELREVPGDDLDAEGVGLHQHGPEQLRVDQRPG